MRFLYFLLVMLIIGILLFFFGKSEKAKELAGYFVLSTFFYGFLVGICLV